MSIVSRLFSGPAPKRTETADLSADEVLDVLSSERKRNALQIIDDLDDGHGVELPTVADMLATLERSSGDNTDSAYKRAYVSLYQTHIPQLETSGLVRVVEGDRAKGPDGNPDRLFTTDATGVVLDVLDDVYDRVEGGEP